MGHVPAVVAWLLCALVLTLPAALPATAAPVLESNTDEATAGFFRLSWEVDTTNARVERAPSPDFAAAKTVYEGPDRARVLSGEPDGRWHFRVAALEAGRPVAWSEPVSVTVEHHPLSRAFWFFGIGAAVFLATLALIAHGARRGDD